MSIKIQNNLIILFYNINFKIITYEQFDAEKVVNTILLSLLDVNF